MTASILKAMYERYSRERGLGGYFFSRASMRFFGDTMRNFGVQDGGIVEGREVWDLYRKGGPLRGHCAYFSKLDGREVMGRGAWERKNFRK
jgi:hypothetical protein